MKVCPRCSFVESGDRRVCSACRRSLVATTDISLTEVMELREQCLAGGVEELVNAPWGPALSVAAPVLAAAGAQGRTGEPGVDADDFAVPGAPANSLFGPARTPEPGPRQHDVPQNRPLAAMAVGVEDRPKPRAPGRPPVAAPGSGGESTDMSATRHKRHRNVAAVMVLLVVGYFALNWVSTAFDEDEAAELADPTIPVGELPWHRATYGETSGEFPGQAPRSTVADGQGGTYEYERHDLADVTISVTIREAFGLNATDASLRSVASARSDELGMRLVAGTAQDLTFGTGFSARSEGAGSLVYSYLLLVDGDLIEVQATVLDPDSARAVQIYERAIRSFEPI